MIIFQGIIMNIKCWQFWQIIAVGVVYTIPKFVGFNCIYNHLMEEGVSVGGLWRPTPSISFLYGSSLLRAETVAITGARTKAAVVAVDISGITGMAAFSVRIRSYVKTHLKSKGNNLVHATLSMYTNKWFFSACFFPTHTQFDLIANYCKFMQQFPFKNEYI